MFELIIYYKLSIKMDFKYILFIIILIGSSSGNEYDDISEINYKFWNKKSLTCSFVNNPIHLNTNYKNVLYY
jgi:hypothetical protein